MSLVGATGRTDLPYGFGLGDKSVAIMLPMRDDLPQPGVLR